MSTRYTATPWSIRAWGFTIATVCFAFQIFCDFSGYSDIAIGAAQVLGFRLMDNFRRPYFATSIAEFWHRWHISLSTWFRDYLYIPLGGNRAGIGRWHANIFIVFLVSGLWHGPNWTYVVWGALHGSYMVLGRLLQPVRNRAVAWLRLDKAPRFRHGIQIATTFVLVCFAWIFFRARTLSEATYVVANIFRGWNMVFDPGQLRALVLSLGLTQNELLIVVAMVAAMEIVHVVQSQGVGIRIRLARRPLWFRWAAYSALLWCIIVFGVFRHKEFIYFTF